MFSTIYLEAQGRPQSLYTLKWQLRAAGIAVRSTWHDEVSPDPNALLDHLQYFRVQRLKSCDALVILSGTGGEELRPELALLLGLALSAGLQVVVIGEWPPMLDEFPAVRHFAGIEEFTAELQHPNQSNLAA